MSKPELREKEEEKMTILLLELRLKVPSKRVKLGTTNLFVKQDA